MAYVEYPKLGHDYCYGRDGQFVKVIYRGEGRRDNLIKIEHTNKIISESDRQFLREFSEKLCGESATKGGRKVMRKTKSKKHHTTKRRMHKRRTHKRRI